MRLHLVESRDASSFWIAIGGEAAQHGRIDVEALAKCGIDVESSLPVVALGVLPVRERPMRAVSQKEQAWV